MAFHLRSREIVLNACRSPGSRVWRSGSVPRPATESQWDMRPVDFPGGPQVSHSSPGSQLPVVCWLLTLAPQLPFMFLSPRSVRQPCPCLFLPPSQFIPWWRSCMGEGSPLPAWQGFICNLMLAPGTRGQGTAGMK